MKKIFTLIVFIMFVVESNALTFRQNGVQYEVTSTQKLTLKVTKSPQYYYGDVVIPENVVYNDKTFTVTAIDDYTFVDCTRVTSLSIPKTVIEIGIQLFNGAHNLREIKVNKDNPKFCDVEGVLFSKDTTVMYFYPNAKSTIYQLPKETKTIRESCFSIAWNLTDIILNEGLEFIEYSFYYVKLTELVFPSSMKRIENNAFLRSTMIKKIYCKSKTPPDCWSGTFDDATYLDATLYVPIGSLEEYKNARGWANFCTIQEYDEIAFVNISAAKKVSSLIDAIATVEYTEICNARIEAARSAYDTLTEEQKALVTNLEVLTKAQQTYDNLKAAAEKLAADKAKADPVIAKINAIGKVEYTYACKDKIDEANNAYNALTNDQKVLVTNVDILTTAQQTYDNLKAAAEKLIADKAEFENYKSEIIAIIDALAKEDDSDAVKEIIRKAISDIESLEYEVTISLDDNKTLIQSFVTSIDEAVQKQRAEDHKATGIEELEIAEKYNIYDLNGRKITSSMLKSGPYIRNGKKMVVK